jgi:hypothetical protein
MRVVRTPFGATLLDVIAGGAVAAQQGSFLKGLAAIYDRIEIRTSVTPPAVIDLYGLAHDDSPPSPVTKFLKPTIILSGKAGTDVIAPYGEAEGGWGPSIGAMAFIVGTGFALGWFARGRRR